ncbi:mannonate dehydratase [Microbulbifer rhizosphaerae]|uniref:Mannonate dehydratase n=1 Tax=Microbulbifer rhizosphaerae TaxID=1562603 RepID=A0A7W4WCU3_9GAMM|nr:mannonate dehydratase [Microbulbifer rhizosphaerae]MBB3061221.1 mannonate dehydratase [Microbulbifer rhizosphaerae]
MRESWRWFGPNDPVSLDDIRQAGATDIVSALHHIPTGEVWPVDAIRRHKASIETADSGRSQLKWSVVESIPVHEDIKLSRPGHRGYVDNWIASMENLAECGIKVICYNFMPVIDWTRTDLSYRLPSGAYALRFDQRKFAAFDLFILERKDAECDYSEQEITEAKATFSAMTEKEKQQLTENIIAGLPGRMTDSYRLDDFRSALDNYRGIDRDTLRRNLFAFLSRVLPIAEKLGVKLAIHPDDPPRDMLGLPRIICTAEDLEFLFGELPSPANGMTLCVGTYGSRPDNDLPEMARRFSPRIHFAHLRGVSRDADEQRSFYEACHLDSDIDMVQVVWNLLAEEQRRGDSAPKIFIRPDHGHQMMDDIGKTVNPGYSAIGRLKGLAEIRGVIRALSINHLS